MVAICLEDKQLIRNSPDTPAGGVVQSRTNVTASKQQKLTFSNFPMAKLYSIGPVTTIIGRTKKESMQQNIQHHHAVAWFH